MQLSHYFLRNTGLVGGVSTEIDSFWFFSDFSIWPIEKTSCLLQKCKILYKNIVLSFFKQKSNKYWNNIWKEIQQILDQKKKTPQIFFSKILLMWSSQ